MSYRCVIVEDEEPARTLLVRYLSEIPDIAVVGQFANGFEGLRGIQELQPDILFLDVQLPRLSGFELLELLPDPPVVVFTTAYDQYAVRAFESSAADYLLKPYSQQRLRQAVDRALARIREPGGPVDSDPASIAPKEILDRVVVRNGNKIQIIPIGEILYLEAQDDYVMLHLKDERHLKERTMRYFEEHLPPDQFVRTHRSWIVQVGVIDQIELYDRENYILKGRDGRQIPVSRSGYQRLKEVLKF